MIAYPPDFDSSHVILVRNQAIATDLDSYLSRIDPGEARLATSYIFQIPPELREELGHSQSDHVRADLLARTSDRNLYTLTYISDRHELCRITMTGLELLEIEEMDSALRRVCETELHRLVEKTADHCFYRATPRYHFVAPSGRHCSIFLRVGDIITSRDALERLAFWILPATANAGAILVDNWSIASVALRALQAQSLDVPFDCLSYHPHQDRRDAEAVVGDLIQSLPPNKDLLCLISVASSGRYTEVIRQIAKEFNLQDNRLRFLGLYRLRTETSLDALCNLEESPANYLPTDCPFCREGSRPVALHPALYYLKEFPEKAVMLQESHFSTKEFIVKYWHLDLLSVHRDDRSGRHHAFHIDIASLLHDPAFQETFRSQLRALDPRPEIVVTPQDDVSSKMGEAAGQELAIPHVAINSLRNLAILQEPERERLNNVTRVLIVDDVLVSGARIEDYNKALRESPRPLEAVHFLVGLARPTSRRAWSNLRITLTTRVPWEDSASLNAVETLFLPDWQERQCPWCREFHFLSRFASLEPEPPSWLKQRLARLTERERGMREEPILVLPDVNPRTLGSGSLAGPEGMSSMATLFSVASALQALRNDDDNRQLNPHFPAFQVFGVRNLRNYSEGLLRGVLLRTVLPGEWSETIEVSDLEQLLREAARVQDQDIILGEIIIAAVRGSIDKSVIYAIEEVLKKHLSSKGYDLLEQTLLTI